MDRKGLQRKLIATFRTELKEHLSTLNKGFLALEKGLLPYEQKSVITELFRAAHSLKGAARAVDLADIEKIAHRMEDLFGAIQRKELPLGSEIFDTFFAAADSLKAVMAAHLKGETLPSKDRDEVLWRLSTALKKTMATEVPDDVTAERPDKKTAQTAPEPEQVKPQPAAPETRPPSPTPPAPKTIQTEESIRVATTKLDLLMDRIGELMVARMRTDQRLRELRDLHAQLTPWQKDWRQVSTHYTHARQKFGREPEISPLLDFLELNQGHFKAVCDGLKCLIQNFAGDHNRLTLLSDDLQDGVRRVRMRPIATLFDQFPRMVRDMARQQGKDVDFKLEGTETEVDRKVLEIMKDPIMHLLRNAVDHGIEPPDLREKAGKPQRGTIHLRAARKGHTIVLEVADDGSGIDQAALKHKAVATGLLMDAEMENLSEKEALALIFHSGLSTMAGVTEISGRGVGLDVVRENLERLHGLIEVNTSPGRATNFVMTLPLTLATSNVLLVEASGITVAVPSTSVERILKIVPDSIGSIDGQPAIQVSGQVLPLVSLARVLELAPREKPLAPDIRVPVVVLGLADKRVAFRVDGIQDTQEVVIKTAGSQLKRVRNVAGATILGSGAVVMILNVADLMKSGTGRPDVRSAMPVQVEAPTVQRVLVVDDSITTRTLEKNILGNAGYEVLVAADGQEALDVVQNHRLNAIVTDIDMPRMDGFDLTEKVKKDDRFKELPVILVTSMESPQDKIRGMEAGADSYIVKSNFDQTELLKTIERLVR